MKKIPKLRFSEFSGEWEEKKLGNIIKSLKAGVSVNSEDIPAQSTEFGILKTSCIFEGKFFPDENKKILENEVCRATLKPEKGRIIISRMNTPQLTGAVAYVDSMPENLFLPDRLWQTEFHVESLDGKWLSYLLNTPKYSSKIKDLATGTSNSMKNISKESFLGLEILEASLPEQEEIASFLSSVDSKIEKLERKKELWEQYKKGMMQKIFSQELRFRDENGEDYPEWEEKSLGEILSAQSSGISNNTLEENEGDYPIYGATGLIKNINFYEIEQDYIAIVKDGAGAGRTLYCLGQSSVLATLQYLLLKGENNLKFCYYLLRILDFTKYLVGSTIPHIYFKDYSLEKFNIPSLPEQTQIADFLSSIDTKIEIVEKELLGMKEFKKGLLQKMFV